MQAIEQEANRQYASYCLNQATCGFSSSEQLYSATHRVTVITFSNSSTSKYCERNANAGEQGVLCGSNSSGNITPIIAAHEMAHVFNALIHNNGYVDNDPYHDLANERVKNRDFPAIDVDITPGHKNNGGNNGEDFANMYSMWVFNEWPDPETVGGSERKDFMNNHMYNWITQLLSR